MSLLREISMAFSLSEDTRIDVISYLLKDYTFLGMGKDRMTWLSPNGRFVLKFPRTPDGIGANAFEARTWKESLRSRSKRGPAYAPCRLLKDGTLLMLAVSDLQGGTDGCDSARAHGLGGVDTYQEWEDGELEDLPDWVYEIDCCQVGRLRNGKLVAYDYGG